MTVTRGLIWSPRFLYPPPLCKKKRNVPSDWKRRFSSEWLKSKNQCPWLWLAGPEQASGRERHQGREDGWLWRLKVTVCAKSNSQVLHLPSISLLTRQGVSGAIFSPFAFSSFTHSHTHAHTYAHTFKYAQSRLLAFLSQFRLVLICGMLFSLNLLKRSQSHSQPQSARRMRHRKSEYLIQRNRN